MRKNKQELYGNFMLNALKSLIDNWDDNVLLAFHQSYINGDLDPARYGISNTYKAAALEIVEKAIESKNLVVANIKE